MLLTSESSHKTTETSARLPESFAQDVIFAISNGKFLTLKYTALSIGLHSITGLKIPIIMLSRLGHCITNDMVREIETAQAEQTE